MRCRTRSRVLGSLHSKLEPISISFPCAWEDSHVRFMGIPGFKEFMSMEVGLGLILVCGETALANTHDWTPLGPGGEGGVNFCFGRRTNFASANFLQELIAIRSVMAELDPEFDDWVARNVQFVLCEFDKWTRTQIIFVCASHLHQRNKNNC